MTNAREKVLAYLDFLESTNGLKPEMLKLMREAVRLKCHICANTGKRRFPRLHGEIKADCGFCAPLRAAIEELSKNL